MPNQFSRRAFLATTAVAAAASGLQPAVRAIEPIKRPGQPRLRLGLAAYSFRQYFPGSPDAAQAQKKDRSIDLFKFVDYCAEHGVDGAELTSYYFDKNPSDEFLTRIKRHAFIRGVSISGTSVGNTFTHPPGPQREEQLAYVKQWIDNAALMGAPHIRIFAGNAQREGKEKAKQDCLENLKIACDHAAKKGVMLGLENHGGIVAEADDLLDLVRAVDSPWLGINWDSGNFHTADPYGDLAKIAPYAVNVQVKTELRARGRQKEDADLGRLVKILRDANYQGFVVLEYEAAPDPWDTVPGILERLKKLLA